jgi:hypothetical protein
MKNPAFSSSGIETSSVPTKLLMLGIAFMLLKGLRTLRILKGLRFKSNENVSMTLYSLAIIIGLRWYDNNEIYDIPVITDVGKRVKYETHGNNFNSWLKNEQIGYYLSSKI